ncbi:OmpA family protein [Kangiella sediminilitoris]|uniref:OmpA/MotB domain protein n=1 Tax=Kangiella sediminilitoris TaxID=1144748 RepID=A0A1B3B848_9GAMM|nr:OmpA family protein [Kangiella sediminilitoris]AOE48979.1 OmpA/MotB domain protein [Kangiella sediminilitoris]
MKKKLIVAACMLALGSTAFAEEGDVKDRHGFYGYIGLHDLDLDVHRDTSERIGGDFGLGWAFNKNWQIEGLYQYTDDMYNNTLGSRTDVLTYSLDVLYNDTGWIGSAETHPFLKVGYGQHDDKYGVYHPDFEDEFYKVGLGMQHFANDNVFMRVGFDFMDSGERGDDHYAYFNIGYFFGETVRAAAAPKVEETPMVEAKDSDGDGVLDADDRCPGTPAGAAVDAYGCALDSDGDGVADYKDACPNTEAGAQVDEKGCKIQPKEEVVVDMRLNFDTNKYAIKPEMVSEIAKVAEFLRQYPDVNAEIQGHTDSVGSNQYNQGLSERRANSVKDYLIDNFGIEATRLTAVGYGEERPIGDNSTEEGRALNRRVEASAQAMK